ncbi:MAG: peptidase C45 [Acidobacteria bacterium]|nr:peptidase C45 [Acidobacteriota bacterium]
MRKTAVLSVVLLLASVAAVRSRAPQADPRLAKAARAPERNGWVQVHLEGSPAEIGFQHGYLLAAEILDNHKMISTELTHDEKKDWPFFRQAAREIFWPHVEAEYRQEFQGIVDGLKARDIRLDLWDVVAMNAFLEFSYYDKWVQRSSPAKQTGSVAEHCSAFVATGRYTRDGRVVIAHNNWSSYADGARWNIIFDIVPAAGHRILMDGMPGLIHSGDDFGLNSAGILITETTISRFVGFDPDGIPEFVRARKAMQYSSSIDEFARIMKDGNNGGYANDWLVADRKTNEIASLELGLKNVTLDRTRDGFFVGANFPINPKLAREEAPAYDFADKGNNNSARHARWLELMAENKGTIDVAAGKRFLADHVDTFQKKVEPNERTLCGHIDLSPRGMMPWMPPYGPAGAVQSKVTDSAGAENMTLQAALGHACGIDFKAAEHLKQHPEFAWQKDILRDLPSHPWTEFRAK